MPSNWANKLLTIHHDHQPAHCGTFVKSMYLHMSHTLCISSFSNNYASNLKLKDITLYSESRSHKQELSKVLKWNFPRIAMYFIISTYVHCTRTRTYTGTVRTRTCTQGPSVRLAVDCVQCMQCNVHVVHGYSGPSITCHFRASWLDKFAEYHFYIFFIGCLIECHEYSMFIMLHIHVFWGRCFTSAHLWNRSAFLMGLGKFPTVSELLYRPCALCFISTPPSIEICLALCACIVFCINFVKE